MQQQQQDDKNDDDLDGSLRPPASEKINQRRPRRDYIERQEDKSARDNSSCGDKHDYDDHDDNDDHDDEDLRGENTTNERRRVTNGAEATERSGAAKFIGKLIILLTVVSFLFVGIFINVAQLLLLTTIRFSDRRQWRRWHKRINSQLVYVLFSPPICLLYYWSNASLRIELDDLEALLEMSRKPMLGIIIPNHSYELDYMVSFVLADQLGGVGCYKSMSKDELKYLPIIGWAMWMSDIIFVKRDWKRDRAIMGKKLDALLDYDQTLLGIFAEGTRFTPEKHRLSVQFAESRNMQPFKYHLVPRPRGFNYAVRHYIREIARNQNRNQNQDQRATREEDFRILNLQIVMPDKPKFRDFIEGRQLRADVFCEEIKLTEEIRKEVLESADEDNCPKLSKLLMDIYARKDQLMDEYLENGARFSRNPKTGGLFPYRKGRWTFVVWLAGFCFTYGSLGYLAVSYLAKSVLFWTLLAAFFVACIHMLKRIARESKIPKTPAAVAASASKQRIYADHPAVKQKLV